MTRTALTAATKPTVPTTIASHVLMALICIPPIKDVIAINSALTEAMNGIVTTTRRTRALCAAMARVLTLVIGVMVLVIAMMILTRQNVSRNLLKS